MFTNLRIIGKSREPSVQLNKYQKRKLQTHSFNYPTHFWILRWYVTNIVVCEAVWYWSVQISFFWGEQYWIQLETTKIVHLLFVWNNNVYLSQTTFAYPSTVIGNPCMQWDPVCDKWEMSPANTWMDLNRFKSVWMGPYVRAS